MVRVMIEQVFSFAHESILPLCSSLAVRANVNVEGEQDLPRAAVIIILSV